MPGPGITAGKCGRAGPQGDDYCGGAKGDRSEGSISVSFALSDVSVQLPNDVFEGDVLFAYAMLQEVLRRPKERVLFGSI